VTLPRLRPAIGFPGWVASASPAIFARSDNTAESQLESADRARIRRVRSACQPLLPGP